MLPKCCAEHQKPGTFQRFSPTFQKLFLKRDLFDSLNGLRYPQVGGCGQGSLYGKMFRCRKLLENGQTPTSQVHAVLGGIVE